MTKDIRVTRIQVVRLFNEINYDIRLEDDKPVGIIIGPNGRGKTTILKMLSFILFPNYDLFKEIKDIPFARYVCYLSNGKRIELSKKYNEQKEFMDFEYRIIPTQKGPKSYWFTQLLGSLINNSESYMPDHNIIDMMSYDTFDEHTEIPRFEKDNFSKALYIYLLQNDCCKPSVFIGISRLQASEKDIRNNLAHDIKELADPLIVASNNLARIIRAEMEKYNNAVSIAKDRLPRIFLKDELNLLDLSTFLQRWHAYTDELRKYQRIGLIEKNKELIDENEIPAIYETKKEFLNAYLEAFCHTTDSLYSIYRKLDLFKSIFDERNSITHKTMQYGSNGINLYSGNDKIRITQLSSGEKNDFIMFYNLIFAREDSIILIDEPEISLHIEWQESYLDHLIEICKLNKLQAIVATHSPNIVSTHYDCLLNMGEQYDRNN